MGDGQRVAALAERSSYVENVLRHGLVMELSSLIWQRDPRASLQVFNAEVDDAGFDIVLSLGSQVRYVQLKQSHDGKLPPHCSVRLSFSLLPGSCVVLMAHSMATLRLTSYRFFGAEDSASPMGLIDGFRHSIAPGRRNAEGDRKVRPHYRNIPVSKFIGPLSASQLLETLFPAFAMQSAYS